MPVCLYIIISIVFVVAEIMVRGAITVLIVAYLLRVGEATSTVRSTPKQDINLQCTKGEAVAAITNIFVPALNDFSIQLICTKVANRDADAQSVITILI